MRANTEVHYGSVAKTFHWLTALLILAIIPLGVIAHGMPIDTSEELARKAELFRWHKTLGVVVFFVALARILWAATQPRPRGLHPDAKLETFAAEVAHFMLYGCLILVPLTGWIHHAATTGFAPLFLPFGDNLPFVPKDAGVAKTFSILHIVFKNVMVVTLLLHIAGALKHVVIDHDKTLARMIGRPDVPMPPPGASHALPVVTAGAIFAAVFAGLSLTGSLTPSDAVAAEAPVLEDVASDWTVTEGTLGIEVVQFGSPVQGTFADWTAAIQFDDSTRADDGERGSVSVTVSIPSLTLGSVTGQALGADYFDAATFPTATFEGPILAQGEAFVVDGTLTIRDQSQPVSLPFDLSIVDGVATASGTTTVQRLGFNVGQNMPDGSNLGLDVVISMELTATRAE